MTPDPTTTSSRWRRHGVVAAATCMASSLTLAAPAHATEVDTLLDCFGDRHNASTVLVVPVGEDHFYGTEGDDVIIGTDASEIINGNGGDDIICAGREDDTVFGGDGFDRLDAEAGYDTVYGNDDGDTIHGGAHNDVIWGYGGDDTIYGQLGDDTIYCDVGDDYAEGGNDLDSFQNEGVDSFEHCETVVFHEVG
jgi:Ca2+-binding RTX toxin-like protein